MSSSRLTRTPAVFAVGLALGGLAAVAWIVSTNGVGNAGGYLLDAELGAEPYRNPAVGVALVRWARSSYDQRDVEAPAVLGSVSTRPVIVCAHVGRFMPSCGRGEGETLAAATAAAAALARAKGQDDVVLTVDVEVHAEQVSWDDLGHAKRDPGVWGYRSGAAVLPPSQVLSRGIYGGDAEDKEFRPSWLRTDLAARLEIEDSDAITKQPVSRIRTVAWVEDDVEQAVQTYRLHRFERPSIDPDHLAERTAWAADHLASTIVRGGRVRYLFDPVQGVERPGYNLLRHGGTTYSLLQAYQRFEHEPWLTASEEAIGYLLAHSRRDVRSGPFGGGEVLWVEESRWVKLGGAGLALVMLTQHMQATGSDQYLEEARAYARYLVSQQQDSGEFVYFASRTPGGPVRDRTSAYYPGEAILGLAQLYAVDPDPLWLATATRGADWLIDVRDAGKGSRKLANDHWLMIALSHLVRHTGDPRYVDHSLALAQAVAYQAERNRPKVATHPDYFGGYYDPPRSTPAATRGEGLVAVLDTCALAERDCPEVEQLLRDTAIHEQWSQYTPTTVWWTPLPQEIVGGFAGGIMDVDLRNDFTQHNLSSLLGTERHLRTGVTLPGGPSWSAARQLPYEPTANLPIEELLEPLRKVRGLHRWDATEPRSADGSAPEP